MGLGSGTELGERDGYVWENGGINPDQRAAALDAAEMLVSYLRATGGEKGKSGAGELNEAADLVTAVREVTRFLAGEGAHERTAVDFDDLRAELNKSEIDAETPVGASLTRLREELRN